MRNQTLFTPLRRLVRFDIHLHALILVFASLALAAITLSGCATQSQVAKESVNYNKALGTSANKILLLNAARASLRMPIVYSRLGSQTIESTGTAGATLAVPIGNIGTNAHVLGLSGGWSDKRNVNLETLVDQKYLRAVRSSISQSMFKVYWTTGWNRGVILKTFVSRIRECRIVNDECTEIVEVENDPDSSTKRLKFDKYISKLLKAVLPEADTNYEVLWPDYEVDASAITLKDMIAADKSDYLLTDGKLAKKIPTNADGKKLPKTKKTMNFVILSENAEIRYELTLRSPESMLYYLGETLRNEKCRTPLTVEEETGKFVPYFKVCEKSTFLGGLFEHKSLTVRFQGKLYYIPKENVGRTYTTLSLVDHVFGQLQERSEPPGVSALTLATPTSAP